MSVRYGWVSSGQDLESGLLPAARGPWTEWLFGLLSRPVRPAFRPCPPVADPLSDDDAALALYVLYELHYRGFEGVDEGWEWEPSLLAARARLEAVMLERLREGVGVHPAPGDVAEALVGRFGLTVEEVLHLRLDPPGVGTRRVGLPVPLADQQGDRDADGQLLLGLIDEQSERLLQLQ